MTSVGESRKGQFNLDVTLDINSVIPRINLIQNIL